MTNTFRVTGSSTYVLAVDGANYGRFGLQAVSYADVLVFIGTAAPAENTDDYIVLANGRTRELVASLDAADKVFVRCRVDGAAIAARGFREGRT